MHINKKIASAIAATLMLGTVLVGCGNGNSGSEKAKHTAALVTDGGSIDDKSFNQSAWEGLEAWGKENKLEKGVNGYNYAQSNSDADFTPNINKLIKAKYNTIFGIGYKLAPAIKKTAKQNPKTNFVIIDDVVSGKNVASVTFKSEQSSFLAGVAAAETTKTNKVGFLGGVKSDVITTFEKGFIQGVHAVNPKITVDVKYAGSFTKADLGQSMATAMYNNGEDVIFHAAGGTGAGAFTAAKNLAKNIKRINEGHADDNSLTPFKYNNLGSMATIGRNKAVVEIGKFHSQGFFAWILWLVVHLRSILGVKNKMMWIPVVSSSFSPLRFFNASAARM